MKYDFECDCGETVEKNATPSEFKDLKKSGPDCPECGTEMNHAFNPGDVEVCFRGGGWRDKSLREKRYREDRSKKMAKRQKKNHKVPELQPNFQGQPTESWREAKSLAEKADGYFEETYDDRVTNEDS